ncbi:acetyl-CoA acetyltransferase [Dictyobacter formicarum]|uniref:acetyl-CoA C-acetyltransferase n=1 Tax=Dictyobacter formicarum TaxID=2778368 RepID=A0ABQ3VH45_9CHLR|nr:acetyl-CoA C-acyltransferase [Dictyobacter formicarum]GHO84451.1 acetyl-CoA acetyltransferase [Dictyobacter formicarum]
MLQEAVILSAVRTPIGRYNGVLKDVRPDDLGALVIREAIARANISAEEIEDVVLGCANQAGEDNRNVARMSLLLAGLPVTVAGQTVNRLCGSGLQAVNDASQAIWSEQGELFVAGGVESMSRAPFVMGKAETAFPRGNLTMYDTTIGWRFINPRLAEMYYPYSMGETAENVASKHHIARSEQDEFALRSQQRAVAAMTEGRFAAELVNVVVPQKKGEPLTVERDEHPRADTSMAALNKLKPAFKKDGGTVTAGNSAGINDGAAALVLSSQTYARSHGLQPLARIVTTAVAGVDPAYMGLGPIPAARKALQRAGLRMTDMDLVELNEAFAAQSLQCMRELEIPVDKLNVNGGAIALGHPLGASGARILTTLLHELRRREGRYGLACMCIGVGQGIATIIERLS